jgi:murein hydrolase activator
MHDANMRILPFFCFLLSLLAGTNPGAGKCEEHPADLDTELESQTNPQEFEQQKEQLMGLLAQVDERYGDVAASLKNIENQIELTSHSLDKIRKEIGDYQGQIEKLNSDLGGQVKTAYAMGQQDKLKLMLNQQDPALSSRMMVYYEYLNRSRLKKLTTLKETVNYLDQLDKEKQKETELLEKNLGQRKYERSALDEVRKHRNKLIARLNDDFSSKQDQLSLLKESENKLIDLIQTLENEEDEVNQDPSNSESEGIGQEKPDSFPKLSGDFSSLKGKLPLPVRGKLANMFTSSSAEENGKGVLINAKEGAEIKAVTKGKVTYAGTLKGYGLLIIVEHNKEFMTLYAFNQSLFKKKGDWVEAGDVIAAVGQSGGRTTPGLYFEIRQKGKPVDPLVWCRN